MRVVIARCSVDYHGALEAHLPLATRLLMVKADGSVLVHSDGGSYKPLNWMSPPCTVREGKNDDGQVEWVVTSKTDDTLRILIEEILHDTSHDLGIDPGLQKDGVEKHLQELLADHPATIADGLTLVRREFPTAIGPVSLRATNRYTGFYASDTFDVTDAFSFTAGGRYNIAHITLNDQIGTELNGDHTFTRFSPMIGGTWKISPDPSSGTPLLRASRSCAG